MKTLKIFIMNAPITAGMNNNIAFFLFSLCQSRIIPNKYSAVKMNIEYTPEHASAICAEKLLKKIVDSFIIITFPKKSRRKTFAFSTIKLR